MPYINVKLAGKLDKNQKQETCKDGKKAPSADKVKIRKVKKGDSPIKSRFSQSI